MSKRIPLAYQLSDDQKERYDDYAKQRSLISEKAKHASTGVEFPIIFGVFMVFSLILFISSGSFMVVH